MNIHLLELLAFAVALTITGVLIPQILLIAFRKQLFDTPDPRKIHKAAIPRLGGLAFFPAILFSVMMAFGLCLTGCGDIAEFTNAIEIMPFCYIVCSLVILYLVGIADDLIGIKYRAKFVAQILSALLLIAGGFTLNNLHGFLGISEMSEWAAIPLTILLTVFITNAMNLIDGIDGLASGLSTIACAFYSWIFFSLDMHLYALLSICTMATLFPFFYYNVFGNPEKHGKIFMGDTGALTVGLLLSIFSIRICSLPSLLSINASQPSISSYLFDINPAAAAFAPLLIPCCDVVRVYFRRIRHHKNPFLPDKTHIHHKLLALGMSQKTAMPTILAASLALSLLNYWLSAWVNITLLFLFDLVIWTIANILLPRRISLNQAIA